MIPECMYEISTSIFELITLLFHSPLHFLTDTFVDPTFDFVDPRVELVDP